MKPVFIPHVLYQDFILHQFRLYYGPSLVIVNKDWPLITKFWMTDLSHITSMLQDLYSDPRDPASMLRSYLIFLMTHPEKGITEWINVMKRTPIYATKSDIQISPKGVPICPKGSPMKPNGFDHSQNRQKWRCSKSCGFYCQIRSYLPHAQY